MREMRCVLYAVAIAIVVVAIASLTSCSARDADPCSPLAAAVLDQACVEAVDHVMRTECPAATSYQQCDPARVALVACDVAVDAHAERCGAQ